MRFNSHKRSGVILHPTALPGSFGIGEIGQDAYRFIDHLSDMGQSLWQILPIGPVDRYNSPYSSSSTFAGNHLLISLQLLADDGLLDSSLLDECRVLASDRIDFKNVIRTKIPILRQVSKDFKKNASPDMKIALEDFCVEHSYWLDDYARYWALKEENNQKCWIEWDSNKIDNRELINEAKIMQFIFHDQWIRLRGYAREKGIQLVGDMPIYVGYDSADVCFNRDLFQLDGYGKMEHQGGCPPCDYQKEGQLWGTPLYDWNKHIQSDFIWWKNRFKKLFKMVDIIRLDHFIGYARYYRIPIADHTAHNGQWIESPGSDLFNSIKKSIKNFNVIAEDLGEVTDEVIELRDSHDFPGMRVLQFEPFKNFLLDSFPESSVVFTGTHDNDTLLGWFESLPNKDADQNVVSKSKLIDLFKTDKDNIHWEIINYAYASKSNTVIIPIQDILGENSSARFNTPGILSDDNWSWRMQDEKLTKFIKKKMSKLTAHHNRKLR